MGPATTSRTCSTPTPRRPTNSTSTGSPAFAHAEVDFAGQHATGREAVHALYKNAFREAPAVRHLISNVALDIRPGDVVGADLTA